MKIAYLDCQSGISGDMLLGSLIDAGVPEKGFKKELDKLGISGYSIKINKVMRNGIAATQVKIESKEKKIRRNLEDIKNIIKKSDISNESKKRAIAIFTDLADVEARIHNKKINEIHFHEIGAVDSIIDIVGSVIGFEKLGVKKIYASNIPVGAGYVECQHGKIPVPAPATLALLKGIPVYSKEIQTEITTPTAAAFLKNCVEDFGIMPLMKINSIGYGAGTKKLDGPNVLRVATGEPSEIKEDKKEVLIIETNIDDMNPEVLGYVSEILKEKGALDVFLTPIYMKKNRQGTLLRVIINPKIQDTIVATIFLETSTIGVRIIKATRQTLKREKDEVETKWGKVEIKKAYFKGKLVNVSPEYESCKKIAKKNNIPLKEIYDVVRSVTIKTIDK